MTEFVKRNKVGEADPATRRKMLELALRPGPPVKPAAPPAEQMGVSPNTMRLLRDRGKQIDSAVEDPDEYARRMRVKALK